ITFSNLQKRTLETFSDPGLTAFIRSYTGSSLVTFILAAAPDYTSTGQARFAAKEAVALDGGNPTGNPGDFAPYLSFGQVGGSVPPSVLITAPANGADINLGVPIPIELSATDDGTIARVEFYAGTEDPLTRLGEDTSAPYSFTFTPPSAGTYIIRAVATDDQALTGEHSVTVDVGAANPPVVTITSPADNAIILKDAMIVLAATVTDDVSVAKVEFYAGTTEPLTLIGEDTTAPFTMQFTPAAVGSYTIHVVGTDNLRLTNSASIAVVVEEPAANLRTVSTAVGLGLDVQANEHGGISGGGSDLNTRTSSAGDRNEIVALRFDLSDHTLSNLTEVTLNLINFRNNSARQVALYGVHRGVQGGTGLYTTEDWTEFDLFAFGDIPGLMVSDGDFLTQSIDSTKVTPLGQITFANLTKGTTETFSNPALTDFIRGYTGSKLVTFILAAAPEYTSTGQARFASKEAFGLEGDEPGEEPGRYAPNLSFKEGDASELRITSITRIGNELRLEWSGGTGPYMVQRKAALEAGEWVNVAMDVTGTSATIAMEGAFAFFRVQGQ
ncbi:MAG: Ig-like domain-containing protein, partial [Limisphaerales bacterium]